MTTNTWQPPSPEIRRRQALVRRAEALINMRIQEENRLDVSHTSVKSSIKEHISYLEKKIEGVKKEITEQINKDPDLKGKKDLLNSILGVSDATSASILSELHIFEHFYGSCPPAERLR